MAPEFYMAWLEMATPRKSSRGQIDGESVDECRIHLDFHMSHLYELVFWGERGLRVAAGSRFRQVSHFR